MINNSKANARHYQRQSIMQPIQEELNDNPYVVHNSKAVVVKSDAFAAPDKETIKQLINDVIEKLRT